jgi:diamine N-acetyltransferase
MPAILSATVADIPLIRRLAEEIWWSTYSAIISAEQIRYMLDTIYSQHELQRVMKSGDQTFLLLNDDKGPQGFAAYGLRPGSPHVCKLHKIYILPENQGKGYGRSLIEEVKRRIAINNIKTLDLNVNRFNKAREFYQRLGFVVIKEEDVPIGPYFMNDYVMRLTIP